MGIRFALAGLGLLLATGCPPPASVTPPDRPIRDAQTDAMLAKVQELGADGDWLVTRGYKGSDQLVASATMIPLSHAAILDLSHGDVIEAEAKGIHVTNLRKFIHKSHRVILIRPIWAANAGAGKRAVEIARKLVGMPYDFLGTVGLDHPHAYYCSELAVHVYKDHVTKADELPRVMEPGQMYLWGTILYDSRPRPSRPPAPADQQGQADQGQGE